LTRILAPNVVLCGLRAGTRSGEDADFGPMSGYLATDMRAGLIDNRALNRAILVGVLLQILFVLIAHFSPWLETHALLFAGMMTSATMGYLYAGEVAKGYARAAFGGAIAGGLCALIGIALSVLLGDMTGRMLLVRDLISVLTGAVGGIYGQMAADWS
jgi:hypothetical protein